MPLPIPKNNEKQNDFISRCISEVKDIDPELPQDQVIARCFSQWRESEKKMMEYKFLINLTDNEDDIYKVLYTGKFTHDRYGNFEITEKDIDHAIENFDNKIATRFDENKNPILPANYQHAGFSKDPEQSKASGWITKLFKKNKELWAKINWTEKAKEYIKNKEFRFLSPEIKHNWEDEHGEDKGFTFLGIALCNYNFLKNQLAISLTEDSQLLILQNKKEIEMAEIFKTENGIKYPAEAYLFVPDKEKPSTWKLRIWETPELKITLRQLGRAAAAFSPGGFRGQRVDIPRDQISKVKAKLRSLYQDFIEDKEDIPKSIQAIEDNEIKNNLLILKGEFEMNEKIRQILNLKENDNIIDAIKLLLKEKTDFIEKSKDIVKLTEENENLKVENEKLKNSQKTEDGKINLTEEQFEMLKTGSAKALELEKELKRRDIVALVDSFIDCEKPKLTKAQKDDAVKLASVDEEGFKKMMENAQPVLELQTKGSDGEGIDNDSIKGLENQIDIETKKLMADEGIKDYSEALRLLSDRNPKLMEKYNSL